MKNYYSVSFTISYSKSGTKSFTDLESAEKFYNMCVSSKSLSHYDFSVSNLGQLIKLSNHKYTLEVLPDGTRVYGEGVL